MTKKQLNNFAALVRTWRQMGKSAKNTPNQFIYMADGLCEGVIQVCIMENAFFDAERFRQACKVGDDALEHPRY